MANEPSVSDPASVSGLPAKRGKGWQRGNGVLRIIYEAPEARSETPLLRSQEQVRLRRSRAKNRATAARGQSLAEFALVFPLFWTVVIGLIEFSFGFQSVLAVSFASRNAAVIASEAGNAPTADCSILRSVENDLTAPSSARQILTVDIYWTDSNGVVKPGATTTYTRSALSTTNCKVDNVSFTVPYGTPSPNGYPMGTRCSLRSGCPSYAGHSGSTGLDTVGVKLTYRYLFHTPYSAILGGTGWTLERSSEMRLEPFQ